MNKLELVKPNDPILYQPTQACVLPDEMEFLVEQYGPMLDLMRKHGGIGLAAPQIGIGKSFFVTVFGGMTLVINPKILTRRGDRISKPEGCLSFPGYTTFVPRYDILLVEFVNKKGETVRKYLTDIDARCFAHEYDHLQGITIKNLPKR